jgi:glutathione reductase (NADPH)
MPAYDYDFLVIGAGSGGVRASRVAAQLGARVAIVEDRDLGGTCVNLGCVPKKLFVFASQYHDALARAAGFGWEIPPASFNWPELRGNKNTEIARLNQVYQTLLSDAGVVLINGRAVIADPHRVQVGEHSYTAERILIAVGGWPKVPEFPGSGYVITSNDAFHLDHLPETIMIVGGGYIGVEFAGIFNGMGVKTYLCHRGEQLLKGFDEEVRHCAGVEIAKKGVMLHLNTDIQRIEKVAENKLQVFAQDGRHWQVEQVMYAVGRHPKTESLGLENTKVVLNDDGSIQVDDFFQTGEPSIYALGDVIGRMALTPVALAEGMTLAHNLFGGRRSVMNYETIPTAVFSQPPLAAVGLTEVRAREIYTDIDVYKTRFKPMQFSLSSSEERCFLKLVVDKASDKVVGCHMLGPDAAEIIQGLAVALTAGATKKDFDNTLGIHPTLAEEFVTLRQPVS